MCSPANTSESGFNPQQFGQAKSQLASGEGLGRGFLHHFLGERKSMAPATVQTVLDTYYAESRKAAAEKRRKGPLPRRFAFSFDLLSVQFCFMFGL